MGDLAKDFWFSQLIIDNRYGKENICRISISSMLTFQIY